MNSGSDSSRGTVADEVGCTDWPIPFTTTVLCNTVLVAAAVPVPAKPATRFEYPTVSRVRNLPLFQSEKVPESMWLCELIFLPPKRAKKAVPPQALRLKDICGPGIW